MAGLQTQPHPPRLSLAASNPRPGLVAASCSGFGLGTTTHQGPLVKTSLGHALDFFLPLPRDLA